MVSRENVTREALSDLEAQRAQNLMEEKRRKAPPAPVYLRHPQRVFRAEGRQKHFGEHAARGGGDQPVPACGA